MTLPAAPLPAWPFINTTRVEATLSASRNTVATNKTLGKVANSSGLRIENTATTIISDSAMLPGVKLMGKKAITHSILMRVRSRTVRYIRAVHDLEAKTIHLRSVQRDQKL